MTNHEVESFEYEILQGVVDFLLNRQNYVDATEGERKRRGYRIVQNAGDIFGSQGDSLRCRACQ
jgi:hypothetical protein